MVTEIDEERGCVKTYWADVRKRVAKVEPKFAKIVDELNPGKDFPLYLAYYPYGTQIGDDKNHYIPFSDGRPYSLSDPKVPKEIVANLGYGKNDAPFSMVLEKACELFIDLKEEKITIPKQIYQPGSFLSFIKNLSRRDERGNSPNVYHLTSGARSVFLLPNIECATNHANLQRDFNIKTTVAKSLYDHWSIFSEVAKNPLSQCDWHLCLMYFSEKWLLKLHNDPAWIKLKLYLHECAWRAFQDDISHSHYDFIFSMIQKKFNSRQNPYLADTARYIFTIASGESIGYIPLCNDHLLPLNVLQKIFVESYGIKKYFPTIIGPGYYDYKNDKYPVYYPLLYPATNMFSPKTRKQSSTLLSLRELAHILRKFSLELAKDNGICAGTLNHQLAKHVEFNYFHNEPDLHRVIRPTTELLCVDPRFDFLAPAVPKEPGARFASDARFVRGCISIEAKIKKD